jgi:hypothetical protein
MLLLLLLLLLLFFGLLVGGSDVLADESLAHHLHDGLEPEMNLNYVSTQ